MNSPGTALESMPATGEGAGQGLRALDGLVGGPVARHGRLRFSVSIVGAVALHAAALAAVVVALNATPGMSGGETEIIEVSLVSGEALERHASTTVSARGGAASVAEQAGAVEAREAVAGSEGATSVAEPVAPRTAEREPSRDATAGKLDLPRHAVAGDEPAREEPAKASPQERAASAEQMPQVQGGAAARAVDVVPATPAAAAVSAGEVHAYNQSVAVTLSKLKPRGIGEAGLAKVVFRIGAGGAVDDVQLAASTGKSKLDRLATDTVARAKFNAPPTGMTSAQLTYAIAFRFR